MIFSLYPPYIYKREDQLKHCCHICSFFSRVKNKVLLIKIDCKMNFWIKIITIVSISQDYPH